MKELLALCAVSHSTRHSIRLGEIEWPDEHERTHSAIDLVATGDPIGIAMEHTLVGAFAGQGRSASQLERVLAGFEDECRATLAGHGYYGLAFEHTEIDLRKIRLEEVRGRLLDWVQQEAPRLNPADRRPAAGHYRQIGPPELQFRVTLYKASNDRQGFDVTVSSAPNTPDARAAELLRVVGPHAKKLIGYPGEGMVRVLVLESVSPAILDSFEVLELLRRFTTQGAILCPDYIDFLEVWGTSVTCFRLRESATWTPEGAAAGDYLGDISA